MNLFGSREPGNSKLGMMTFGPYPSITKTFLRISFFCTLVMLIFALLIILYKLINCQFDTLHLSGHNLGLNIKFWKMLVMHRGHKSVNN